MGNTVGSQQKDIIIGTLLGDGFLERNGKFVRLVIDHSLAQEQYARWKGEHLVDFTRTIVIKKRFDRRTNKYYDHCILRTNSSPLLEEYFHLFYREEKDIPHALPEIINPSILAVWIMDDGYKRNDCNALRLNTQSYSIEAHRIIQRALRKLQIDATIQKHKAGFVTYIPSRAMTMLRNIVRPFIAPTMEYKIA